MAISKHFPHYRSRDDCTAFVRPRWRPPPRLNQPPPAPLQPPSIDFEKAMNFARNLLGLLLASLLAVGFQSELLAAPQKVTSVEGVTEYRLDNGLRVLLIPDNSVDSVMVHITYLVGSRHEGYGEKGMAHLLEHMLFKGTPSHPKVKEDFARMGVRFNGSTSYDRTNYFETLAATTQNLDWALDVEADRMLNAFVRKSDLDSEMTVVRNEFESGENNPGSILRQR